MKTTITLSPEQKSAVLHSETVTLELKEFTVIAGRYESGYSDDENIKYSSELMTLDDAIEKSKEFITYHFCFIEYHGERLTLI